MRALALVSLSLVAACSKPPPANPSADADGASAASAASAVASVHPSGAVPPGASACNGPGCLRFDSPEDAFRYVLASTTPVVLAIGEAHAQKGSEAIASSTKRFTETLLPIAAKARATDVVVELWAPDPSCVKDVQKTAAAQKPVVATQAATNQNEYLTLGNKAKSLGVTPWLLKPTCNDFAAIADAGADAISTMLGTVKRLTQQRVTQLLQRNSAAGGDRLVLAYGGALHNDLAPDPDTRAYSFGPELAALTHDRYTELDLIVPEYVKDTAVWTKLPWYAAFEADKTGKTEAGKATLYKTGPRSFTIVFPPSS